MPLISAYLLFALLLGGLVIFGVVRARVARPPSRTVVAVTLAAWLVALLFMTLRPAGSIERINLVPDLGGAGFSAFDTLANVAVFLPLGLVLAAAGYKALPAIGAGLGVSFCIEVLQYVADAGRAADVNDLITNTAGAALGWAIGWAIRAGRTRRALPRARS